MFRNPESVPNPLSAEEACNKELRAKHMDYSLDSIFFKLDGDLVNLAETQRRMAEIELRIRNGTPLH